MGDSVSTRKHLIRNIIGMTHIYIGLMMLTQLQSNVKADTIIVAKDGKGDYEKIHQAIDKANE